MLINDTIAFCLEPEALLYPNRSYNKLNNILDKSMQDLIEAIAYHGFYKYLDNKNISVKDMHMHYIATQVYIWEFLGFRERHFTKSGKTIVDNFIVDEIRGQFDYTTLNLTKLYKEYKLRITSDIRDEIVIPKFDEYNKKVRGNEPIEFIADKELKNYVVEDSDKFDSKIENNKVIITPKSNFNKLDIVLKQNFSYKNKNTLNDVEIRIKKFNLYREPTTIYLGRGRDQKVSLIKIKQDPIKIPLSVTIEEEIREAKIKTKATVNGEKIIELEAINERK